MGVEYTPTDVDCLLRVDGPGRLDITRQCRYAAIVDPGCLESRTDRWSWAAARRERYALELVDAPPARSNAGPDVSRADEEKGSSFPPEDAAGGCGCRCGSIAPRPRRKVHGAFGCCGSAGPQTCEAE